VSTETCARRTGVEGEIMKGDIALAGFVLTAEEWQSPNPRVASTAARPSLAR
jgi:hypothetical protein